MGLRPICFLFKDPQTQGLKELLNKVQKGRIPETNTYIRNHWKKMLIFFLRGEGERSELGYFKRTGLDDPHGSLPTWDILWFYDSMNLWKELYHDNVQGLYYFVSNVWIIQLLSWGSSWCFAYHWGLDNFLTLHPTNILQNFLIHPGGLTPAGSFPVFGEKNQKSTNEKTHELR